jgi:hypothetical protein
MMSLANLPIGHKVHVVAFASEYEPAAQLIQDGTFPKVPSGQTPLDGCSVGSPVGVDVGMLVGSLVGSFVGGFAWLVHNTIINKNRGTEMNIIVTKFNTFGIYQTHMILTIIIKINIDKKHLLCTQMSELK